MAIVSRLVAASALILAAGIAAAQEAWIQIEARPSRAQAEARAAEWDSQLDGIASFSTGGRWYAIAIGPFSEAEAEAQLRALRARRAIPPDSFLTDGRSFGAQVYSGEPALTAAIGIDTPAPSEEPLIPTEETVAEARAAERALSREERQDLQRALEFEGFYRAAIDGAFGPGTRRSIEAWQAANRYEATGFLTTRQREELLGGWQDAIASLGLGSVTDTRAGISITLPLALLGAPDYNPPFARYEATDGSGAQVLLISQSGDATTLAGLYEVMQTLEIVPLEGPRERNRTSFTLTGEDDEITSHSFATLAGDAVKGFTLVWPAGDEKRRNLVLAALQESFSPIPGVLPDIAPGAEQSIDLLAGLSIRRPERSRSGFFVSPTGAVLTSSEAVSSCDRITLGDDTRVSVTAEDAAAGLALLTPEARLSPLAVARLASSSPRLGAEVAVAGYSFGGALGAPTVTFGSLEDVRGLDGDTTTERLSLAAEEGDTGGPVFDEAGAVIGLLRPREDGARVLPADVSLATDATIIADFLTAAGLTPAAADPGAALAPQDLTVLAADMTVLVNCWN